MTTSTKDSTYAISFFPTDNRVLITRDQSGNELNHLYVLAGDGAERDLTPGDKLKAQFAGWTHDGSAFYVASNERDARFFDLYRYDAKTYARTMFFENKNGYLPAGDFLPDDTFGVRMPFHRAAIDSHLIDIIMLWIQNGAPSAGWVAGTDN